MGAYQIKITGPSKNNSRNLPICKPNKEYSAPQKTIQDISQFANQIKNIVPPQKTILGISQFANQIKNTVSPKNNSRHLPICKPNKEYSAPQKIFQDISKFAN